MSILLDTDICSAHIKQRGGLTHRFVQYSGRLQVSVIAVGAKVRLTFISDPTTR